MAGGNFAATSASVQALHHAVSEFDRESKAAAAAASSALQSAIAEAQTAVVASQRRFTDAQRQAEATSRAAEACTDNCEGLQAQARQGKLAAVAAQRQHQSNLMAKGQIDRAAADLLSALRSNGSATNQHVQSANAYITEYAQELVKYLSRSQ